MPHSGSTWIDFYANGNDLFINEYHPYNAFDQLSFPAEQKPQLITLIGDKFKTTAIHKLGLTVNTKENHQKAYLQLVPDNAKARSPILIADCELQNALLSSLVTAGVEQHAVIWHRELPEWLDAKTLGHLVYSKLISPFSTIICLFADDLGGLAAVSDILVSWLLGSSNPASDLPVSTYPRVLVLKRDDNSLFNEEMETLAFTKQLIEKLKAKNERSIQKSKGRVVDEKFNALLKRHFEDLRVLAIPTSTPTTRNELQPRWERLRTRIIQASQQIQERRCKARVAFSATHFEVFLNLACGHFARDITTPFSFLEASRLANPVPQDFSTHITNFIRNVKPCLVESFAIPLIASSISLDSCPPEMHLFSAAQVFEHFYAKIFDQIKIDLRRSKITFADRFRGMFAN